jgi:LysR family transcriptional regulator of abg operon
MSAPPSQVDHLVARLRFRHLRLITELQRDGSLRAVAQTLNLTQPAVSKALGEIESAFGFALFTRTARGVTPTAQGTIAIRGAALLLQELAHLRGEAEAGERAAAIIRIGAPPFVAQGYLPKVLARLTQRNPPVRVHLLEERVPMLMQALLNGEVDALVTSHPMQMPDAGPAPWAMPARTSMARRLIEESFMKAGAVAPQPVIESTSPGTNVQLVAAGAGLSIAPTPASRLAQSLGQVKSLRVSPAIPPAPVELVYRGAVPNLRIELLREALGLR